MTEELAGNPYRTDWSEAPSVRAGRFSKYLGFVVAVVGLALAGCATPQTPSTRLGTRISVARNKARVPGSTSTSTTACSNSVNIGQWSDSRIASQMIVVSSAQDSLNMLEQAFKGGVGGVVLIGGASPQASVLKGEIGKLEELSPGGIAPLIMADEEGGGVQVLTPLVGQMPWPRQMAEELSAKKVESLTYTVGRAMRAIGITVDLAPVVDLDSGIGPSKSNPDGSRSFSSNPATAIKYAAAFERGLVKAGVIPVLKHFPGLGGASGNTDFAPASTLSFASLENGGLIPFERLANNAKAVMVSNASVPGLTGGVPASLSSKALAILRQAVGFQGVTITDSLETVSISSFQPNLLNSVLDAAKAGEDMIMLASSNPNQIPEYRGARNVLSQAIASGSLPRSQVEASVGRILVLKGYSPACIVY